jgi:hypothetical protein
VRKGQHLRSKRLGEVMVAMLKMETWMDDADHVSYMSPRQTVDSTQYVAETPLMENTAKQPVCVEKRSGVADRRIAVAPMMNWTD